MNQNADHLQTPLISLDDDAEDQYDVRCIMAVIRHADRTCKQKMSLKFSGSIPDDFPVDEDIRSAAEVPRLLQLVELRRSECRSEESSIRSALRTLRSGRDDLKAKLEHLDAGWILKLKWGGNLTPLGVDQSEQAGAFFRNHLVPDMDVKAFASGDTRCQETASAFMKGLLDDSSFAVRSDDGPDGLGNLDDTPFRHSPLVKNLRAQVSHRLMSGRLIDGTFIHELFPHGGSVALEQIGVEFGSFAAAVLRLKDLIDEFSPILDAGADESVAERWRFIHKTIHRGDVQTTSASSRWRAQQTASGVPLSSLQISLIGEIFDNAQFDFRHTELNAAATELLTDIRRLVTLLAQIVVPLEYGISKEEKSFVGSTFLHPLIRKLRFDFRLAAPLPLLDEEVFVEKHNESRGGPPRLRLYFAHHSHVFSFVSILQSVELFQRAAVVKRTELLEKIASLGYLCELIVSTWQQRNGVKWRFAIDVYAGDRFTGNCLAFDPIRVVEGTVESAEEIDRIFSAVLVIPARDGNLPPHLRLGAIGESSGDTLAESLTPPDI